MTATPEPVVGTCVVGWRDWTKRDRCGRTAVAEVRQIRGGKTGSWRPACGSCALGFEHVVTGAGAVFEQRDPPWIRDLFNPPIADVIPLCTGGQQ